MAEIDWLIATITQIRAARAEMNVPAAAQLKLSAVWSEEASRWIATQADTLARLARLSGIEAGAATGGATLRLANRHASLFLHVGDAIDLAAEQARLAKEIARIEKDLAKHEAKLANPDFRAKADPEVVEEIEERKAEAVERLERLREAQGSLGV